ncbi:hypothetical protein LCGC14_2114710 [marine sediment metagenome]|uniref:Uncharacterized protein n=1 Tax=marine sediment metagenome TaxID=412755 RepID=A0A0F9GJ38_9ZZZZ
MNEAQIFEMVGRLVTNLFFQVQVAQVELAKVQEENTALKEKYEKKKV